MAVNDLNLSPAIQMAVGEAIKAAELKMRQHMLAQPYKNYAAAATAVAEAYPILAKAIQEDVIANWAQTRQLGDAIRRQERWRIAKRLRDGEHGTGMRSLSELASEIEALDS